MTVRIETLGNAGTVTLKHDPVGSGIGTDVTGFVVGITGGSAFEVVSVSPAGGFSISAGDSLSVFVDPTTAGDKWLSASVTVLVDIT